MVGVGEDILDDDEAALLVGIGQAIGGRQWPAGFVLVDVFDVADGIRVFEGGPAVPGDRQLQLADLGFMNAAVHGFGDHTLGQREPDLGDRAGRRLVGILVVQVGFVRGADTLLAGIGPGRRLAGTIACLAAVVQGRIMILGGDGIDRPGPCLTHHADQKRHRADAQYPCLCHLRVS